MDWKSLAVAAAAFTVISQVVYTLGAFIDMPYYTDPANAGLWSSLMMPGNGAPGMEYFVTAILASFFTGFIYASAYVAVKKVFREKSYVSTGAKFGLFLFSVSFVTGFIMMQLMFSIPLGLQLSWLVQGLIVSVTGGIAIAKFA
ncbi:TPA: hypothetical protein HA225_01040 [Candidatus Micrarchaeota archaeon]|nr:hypothetical protein [Candidatus Micrarchaeota archaeon]HIH30961.1 hypothetical protein [Candidatus Micrarchaeota archaeon]